MRRFAGMSLEPAHASHVRPRVLAIGALLCTVAAMLLVPASKASASDTRYPSLAGKWDVGQFNADGAYEIVKARPVGARGGVRFPFLDRPDTVYLTTEHPAYRGRLLGDLTGKTLRARVGVNVAPGTQFTYWGEPDGSDTPSNVRLYFETDISLGPITCPCQSKGWSSIWYSDPVKIDLQALRFGDRVLSVDLDPALWADGQETPGTADDEHEGYFAQAAAHVDGVGLSFAGGLHLHNGVGIVPGTGSGSFRLVSYEARASEACPT